MLRIVLSQLFLAIYLPAIVLAEEAVQKPALTEVIFRMLPLFLMVFIVFHFLVVRPQDKRAKEHASLLDSLKKNEQVVTSSGMIGRVASIEKDYILLEISNNVKVKFEPAHVLSRFEKSKDKN